MSPMPEVPETWFNRDLPVLISVVARVETTGSAESTDVLADTGLNPMDADRAIRALQDAGYCRTYFEGGGGWGVLEISERARRTVGSWPTAETLTNRIIDALETLAHNSSASTPQRTAAQKVLDAVTGDGRAALAGAVGNVVSAAVTGN
jgi:hypothetical protein